MKKLTDIKFDLRPHHQNGTWQTESARFAENARTQLAELVDISTQIKKKWPDGTKSLFPGDEGHSALWSETRKRDLLSDCVKIFSAMAVEGLLNFYGVVRLGQAKFDEHFEKMGPVKKVKALLLVCESIILDDESELVRLVFKISGRRNLLVHANTREMQAPTLDSDKNWKTIPGQAVEAVSDMSDFFRAFMDAVPAAAHLLPDDEFAMLLGNAAKCVDVSGKEHVAR
jgi:hypothetical protein